MLGAFGGLGTVRPYAQSVSFCPISLHHKKEKVEVIL